MATAVRIVIDRKTGKVKFDYEGFVGDACFEAANRLKDLLKARYGVEVEDEEVVVKPEAYTEEREEERQGVGGWGW